MANQYYFFPWIRRGLTRQITDSDPLTDAMGTGGRAGVNVSVKIMGDDTEKKIISQQVELLGPGDITGIDSSAIVKTEPARGVLNFEPNFFPYVEFYEEDFPWRYSPAKPHAEKRLRPWLSLIVLEESEFEKVPLRSGSTSRVIFLRADTVKNVLPKLEQSWAWAHVQVNEGDFDINVITDAQSRNQKLTGILQSNPNAGSSRLLCPRKLKINTAYFAFLVPAFERGRVAGIGGRINQIESVGRFKPSWHDGIDKDLELPVYFDWQFQTGDEDFEAMADKITPRDLKGTSVGKLWMDATNINYGDLFDYKGSLNPDLPGFLPFEGALRLPTDVQAPTKTLTQQNGPEETKFVNNLAGLVNLGIQSRQKQPGELPTSVNVTDNQDDDPLLVPPVYGRWYARVTGDPLLDPTKKLAWLEQLNLDPAFRVAAGLGTEVVRENQEEYVSRAWKQLSENRKNLNHELQRLRFAQQVTAASFKKHFLSPGTSPNDNSSKLLALTQSLHTSIISDVPGLSVEGKLATYKAETAFIQPAYRRITRVKGPVMKKVHTANVYQSVIMSGTTQFTVMSFVFNPDPPFQNFNSIEKLIKVQPNQFRPAFFFDFRLQAPNWFSTPGLSSLLTIRNMPQLFKDLVERILPRPRITRPNDANPLVLSEKIQARIIPSASFKVMYKSKLPVASPASVTDSDFISPNSFNPFYGDPTYEELSKLKPELFIPNLDQVQPESFILLEANSAFIEAFLTGVNHELAAEFLWRGFPADMNATFFRQFWDKADGVPTNDSSDIDFIRKWDASKGLGLHGPQGAFPNPIVFVIKASLIKKYPNLVVYAQKARLINNDNNRVPDLSKKALSPIFTGRFSPDYLFAGFALNKNQVLGTAPGEKGGYYFVIAERPGETHFGLDQSREAGRPFEKWNDLSWQDLNKVEECIDLNRDIPTGPLNAQGLSWGKGEKPVTTDPKAGTGDSAQMAAILIQKPVQIFIHASLMVS
jgi:hypothetical protein